MAYNFNGAAYQISRAAALVSSMPLTFSAMVRWPNISDGLAHSVICIAKSSGAGQNQYFYLFISSTGVVTAKKANSAGTSASATAGTIGDTNWHHVMAVFASATSMTAYLDGTAGSPVATSITPASLDKTMVGAFSNSSGALFDNVGLSIALPAIYNVADLNGTEISKLAAGESPLKVRASALVAAPDFLANEWDPVLASTWTVAGATQVANPNARMPRNLVRGLIGPTGMRRAA